MISLLKLIVNSFLHCDNCFDTQGTYLNPLFFQTKEVLAKPFEGCKFTWNKMITDRFQATHTINMSSFKPANYKFGTTYVGSRKLGPNEQYPILIR